MIKVYLVDDQELVRSGFALLIGAQPDLAVVGQAGDGETALRELPGGTDVVLMDVRMPGLDGVEATRRIVERGGPRVLVLTTFDLDEHAYAALRAGASGFLLKDASPADLLSAIRAVHAGDAVLAPSTTRRLLDRVAADLDSRYDERALAELTEREREVLLEVARGSSNAEIAARLFMAEATVKTHVGRILGKLGLRDRVQLVIFAYETGWVRRRS